MEKRYHQAVVWIFSLFIGLFFLANLILPDKDFSPNENRALQTFPRFSFSSLADGTFTEKAERYTSDQFALRDRWIELKARLELMQGRQENNGVFLCDGQQLLEPFRSPDQTLMAKRAAAVNALISQTDVPVMLALVPGSAELYSSLLPEGVENHSQRETAECIYSMVEAQAVDLCSALYTHRDEYVFYRTDHHWTSLGALYGAQEILRAAGVNCLLEPSAFDINTVSDAFYGTYYSSSGFFWVAPDQIDVYVQPSSDPAVERVEGASVTTGALYDYEKLATKDKYRFFLGGNCPLIRIHTQNEDKPSLMILRDSYADSLLPFLLEEYSQIYLIDLRYYHDSVVDFIRENQIDSVLILYGLSNFLSDPGVELMTR